MPESRTFTVSEWKPDWSTVIERLQQKGLPSDDTVINTCWSDFKAYFTERGDERAASHWLNSFVLWVENYLNPKSSDKKGEGVAPRPHQTLEAQIQSIVDQRVAQAIEEKLASAIEGETAELKSRIRALEIQLNALHEAKR